MTVSSGIAMEVHYCMGKKAGVDFYKTADHKCARCGMKNKAGCCHDEHKFYKLSDAHKNVFNGYKNDVSNIAIIKNFNTLNIIISPVVATRILQQGAPSRYNYIPLFIKHCVFRI